MVREVGKHVVVEVAPCGGRRDIHLGGHPPDTFVDELGGGGARH